MFKYLMKWGDVVFNEIKIKWQIILPIGLKIFHSLIKTSVENFRYLMIALIHTSGLGSS